MYPSFGLVMKPVVELWPQEPGFSRAIFVSGMPAASCSSTRASSSGSRSSVMVRRVSIPCVQRSAGAVLSSPATRGSNEPSPALTCITSIMPSAQVRSATFLPNQTSEAASMP
jgi:hypothetical protein